MQNHMGPAPQDLQDVQLKFKQYLMQQKADIASHIVSTDDLANDVRLEIYGNAYVSRLIEVLQKDYTALFEMLGEEQFNELASAYIDAYPSTHPSLRFFGKQMADYLLNHPSYAPHPYLYELARFEWGFTDAFDASDSAVMTESDAALLPADAWSTLHFGFHPSIQLIPYEWNILPIWQAIQQEHDIPAPVQLVDQEVCLIWRQGLQTQYRTLDAGEARGLTLLLQGASFPELCEALAAQSEVPEQVPIRAASLLKGWLAAGLITEFLAS